MKGVECCCPEEEEDGAGGIDARLKEGFKAAVRKVHGHLPPRVPRKLPDGILQRFDLG